MDVTLIIQPLLIVTLLVILFFALLQKDAGKLLKVGVLLSVALGVMTTLFPDLATWIANRLGVGRGADLIFYIWMLVSVFMFLMIYVKLLALNRALTKIARHIALTQSDEGRSGQSYQSARIFEEPDDSLGGGEPGASKSNLAKYR
jgi:hypothetical protein